MWLEETEREVTENLRKDRTMAHSRMVIWDGKGSVPRMSPMATMVFGHKAHRGGKDLLCPDLRLKAQGEKEQDSGQGHVALGLAFLTHLSRASGRS